MDPAPRTIRGPVVDAKHAFAFDLPPGCSGERVPGIREYWIFPDSGSSEITVGVEAGAWLRCSGPQDAFDCMLAYASEHLAVRCDYDGENRSGTADSLLAPRRFRTRAGLPAVEYMLRVHEEFYGYGEDYKAEDSTAVIIEHSSAYPTEDGPTSYCKVERMAGPEFLVDVGTSDHPRFVRVELTCSHRPDSTALRLARSIVMSIREAPGR